MAQVGVDDDDRFAASLVTADIEQDVGPALDYPQGRTPRSDAAASVGASCAPPAVPPQVETTKSEPNRTLSEIEY